MSTRIIGKDQALAIANIGWWTAKVGDCIPRPYFPAPPSPLLDDESEIVLRETNSAAEMEQNLEQAHKHGYTIGMADGERVGSERANHAIKATLDGFAGSIAEFVNLRRLIRHEAERDLVKLSLAVAKKILHRELAVDPVALAGVIKAAVSEIEAREVEKIRLNPKDALAMGDALSAAGLPPNAQIIQDASLAPGAILIETSRGQLDASVSAQLNEIERGFVDRLEGR